MQAQSPKQNIARLAAHLRGKVQLGPRLPVWRLRLLFGVILMTFSELVMWQNPLGRELYEWPVLLILYVALGAIFLDVVVRFQVHTPAALGFASGIYGLISASLINHTAFENLPFGLLVRGLGLQVGAGFLALILFVLVMRGKMPDLVHIGAALAVGAAWGIWLHWYPVQSTVNWGLVSIERAQQVIIPALVAIGGLFYLAVPRFGTLRETQLGLYWWEMVVVGVPLFGALLVGMIQNVIPFVPLFLPLGIGGFCLWALRFQQPEHEPSILGQITFSAPNLITYMLLASAFLVAGSLAYALVEGPDSPVGVALYFIVLGFGSAWLPFASGLILWLVLRTEYPARRKRRLGKKP